MFKYSLVRLYYMLFFCLGSTLSRLVLFALLFSSHIQAENLYSVPLDENEFLLLSVSLDKNKVSQSVDAYSYNQKTMIAVEPLFNSLKLRYQLRQNSLKIWRNDQIFEYSLLKEFNDEVGSDAIWGDDGYFQYVSLEMIVDIFGLVPELNKQRLTLIINTTDYQFPITILQEQQAQRFKSKLYQYANTSSNAKASQPITIEDQYRLATLPHGEIYQSLNLSDDSESQSQTSVQLVSDLLYHSARINLSKTGGSDLTGGINFTRYKTSPNDMVLGAFDQYTFGDVSSYSGGSIIGSQGGVGFTVQNNRRNYRTGNSQINIEEFARPGWEAELFRNNQLVTSLTVPETGLLVFNNVEIFYGRNDFVIKSYGPFGEYEEYKQSFPLVSNPLKGGDISYGIYILDNQRSLLNGGGASGFSLNSIGGAIDYGINDRWQLSTALQNYTDQAGEDIQLLGVSNYLSFPGVLFENNLFYNTNTEAYEQSTNISGNLFSQGQYNIEYESSDDLNTSNSDEVTDESYKSLNLNYSDTFFTIPFRISGLFTETATVSTQRYTHNTSFNYKRLRFTHGLVYSVIENQTILDGDTNTESLSGTLGISGTLNENFRLSASLNYDPTSSDFLLDTSKFNAQYRWQDPYMFTHYLSFNYSPATDSEDKWQLSHRLAFETEDIRVSLRSNYNASSSWSFSLNFNLFFGYDYYNQRTLTSSSISQRSATLDIHAYLDRQLNGIPDVLDYNLENVDFYGNQDWIDLKTGETGRVLLPGAQVNTPFSFGATWKDGSETINNDYVVYTHPGARVSVNMPFYLSTELIGFVYRQALNGEVPVAEIKVNLVDDTGQLVQEQLTDLDGYFEFSSMKPNQYSVIIDDGELREKGLTTDIKGYQINTPNIGGFAELEPLYVRRQVDENDIGQEEVISIALDENDIELLVWDEDEEKQKNYFTLPTKDKIMAEHSLEIALKQNELMTKNEALKKDLVNVNTTQAKAIVPSVEKNVIQQVNTDKSIAPNQEVDEFFSLQLGSFIYEASAKEFANKYTSTFNDELYLVENSEKSWQTTYRLYLGKFSQRIQALDFAATNQIDDNEFIIKSVSFSETDLISPPPPLVAESNVILGSVSAVDGPVIATPSNLTKNWVIQFQASKTPITSNDIGVQPPNISLFQARKPSASDNTLWYCLISQGFTTKEEATNALQESQKNGWVTSISTFTDIQSLNSLGIN